MVSLPAGPLTRISFRRDVRVFLTALVGFLGVLILALLFQMEQFHRAAQAEILSRWNVVADAGAREIGSASSEANRRVRAKAFAGRNGVVDVRIGPRTAPAVEGHELVRRADGLEIGFVFDDGAVRSLHRRFALTASICVAAAITGMVLLLFYLPRITRPIEAMLDEARQLGTRDERQEETAYLITTFRESITRMREQEHELKRLHEAEKSRADELEVVTATLTRSLTSGLIALDPDGRVLQLNAAAREVLAIGPDREVGGSIAELLGDSPLAHTIQDALGRRETLTRIEVEHAVGGSDVSIGLTAVPLLGENGRMLGMLALFTDLTPIKRLEARVRAMQTLADLGEMAAGIVHELRNSLSTIVGYLRLVRRSELPAEAASRLRAADEEASQLQAAVDRLLAFARPMELQLEEIRLRDVVTGVLARLETQTEKVAVEVRGDAAMEGDAALLARAVENVIRNAVDAVRERGTEARIEVSITDDPPTLSIADNGVGLEDNRAERLLLPFVSEKPGGFGLGLSLARKIVVIHGGDVELRGAPGQGAVVTMRFPGRG